MKGNKLKIDSPRGTSDIYGEEINIRNFISGCARELFRAFDYREVITPAFEHTGLFSRGIGEGTDIVQKEMYTFKDRKGRSLTLRPEGTAPVVRAIIENNLLSERLPLKLFYIGNMFRYERPQKGRMREFWQLGVEAFGSDNPLMDAEAVWLLNLFFERLGFGDLTLLVNTMGCRECREEFVVQLKKYLKSHVGKLCDDCKIRFEKNPLRIFDCKKESCRNIIGSGPAMTDYLCIPCREHFSQVMGYLDRLGINYVKKRNLVRGFDYYTRTVFEIISGKLESAQNALGGGGRYDNLVEQFGGPDIPAIGFAAGIDRTSLLMKQLKIGYQDPSAGNRFYIINMDIKLYSYSLKVLKQLRENNVASDINHSIRSLKSELKSAAKKGYDYIIIIGGNEADQENVTIKNIKTYEQSSIKLKDLKKQILKITRNGRS